jgi:hypothetical protein
VANKDRHRRFGNVRMRESGRFQIRYPGPDGRMRTGPETYERKGDAERALVLIEAQMSAGEWTDPERAKIKLGDYAPAWITERLGLRNAVQISLFALAGLLPPGPGRGPVAVTVCHHRRCAGL